MPIKGIEQPEYIEIDKEIRLRKFDEKYDFAFEWYQDIDTLWMLDGDKEPYTQKLLDKMYTWWNQAGEVYFIEVLENKIYKSIGDVSFKQDDMPILIGDKNYRKKGIATKVIRKLIERGKELGYKELEIEEIYSWNLDSQKLYTNLGFKPFKETKNGMSYKLIL